MLGTYSFFTLSMFSLVAAALVFNYTRDLEAVLKNPLQDGLKRYEDKPSENTVMFAYKDSWNTMQREFGTM